VNRVWQHLFGRGIVASSDNFGVLGEQPSHPELLDFLADEFRRDGWSLKRVIRRMVLSHAYRMRSQPTPDGAALDPVNALWHRSAVRRLEGEIVRDAILAVSGRLDGTQSGPPVPVFLTQFMQGRGRPGESGPLDGDGRRSIYQAVRRNFLNPFLLTFDAPRPASAVSRRSQSNVPAQALILLNNEFVHDQSRVWAERLLRETNGHSDSAVTKAFRLALAREPSPDETAALRELISTDPDQLVTDLAAVCHVLLNHKEFIFLE
jgi:Protein of unknown function (DUF1553)